MLETRLLGDVCDGSAGGVVFAYVHDGARGPPSVIDFIHAKGSSAAQERVKVRQPPGAAMLDRAEPVNARLAVGV